MWGSANMMARNGVCKNMLSLLNLLTTKMLFEPYLIYRLKNDENEHEAKTKFNSRNGINIVIKSIISISDFVDSFCIHSF